MLVLMAVCIFKIKIFKALVRKYLDQMSSVLMKRQVNLLGL